MTHWRTLVDDSEWVHHCDIDGKSPITLEIDRVETKEAYNPGTKEKGMLRAIYFKGAKKPLGINITNGYIIQSLHGEHIESWHGKKITLRTAKCKGDDCIRVDAPTGTRLPKQCPKFDYTDGNN